MKTLNCVSIAYLVNQATGRNINALDILSQCEWTNLPIHSVNQDIESPLAQVILVDALNTQLSIGD